MFNHLKENFLNMVTSRLFVLVLVLVGLGGLFIYRCFNLQIVQGEEYLNKFQLQIRKERSIPSSRGRIYDRNGKLLAYNELAYSVTIEDVYESGRNKNAELNNTILRLIHMIQSNGDKLVNDFNIALNADRDFVFTVDGKQRLRFLADVYGYSTIEKMEAKGYKYTIKTADEVVNDLAASKRFGIGDYIDPDDRDSFQVGLGYTKEELLQVLTVRYALNANSYQKYIATTVASNVSEETVAVVLENSNELDGVSIAEDAARRYLDSTYFAQILGYTGRVSPEELKELQAVNPDYDLNDIVGKAGMEYSLETELQGKKGSEVVFVDNVGRVISASDQVKPVAGNDVYLTIDSELQEGIYHLIEEKLAGILLTRIRNYKEYNATENSKSSDIIIPIDDVYYALFNNNVIDPAHFTEQDAGENEKAIHGSFVDKKAAVLNRLSEELTVTQTPYNQLPLEYQVYESYIASLLYEKGILIDSEVDKQDATYLAWTTEEVISLREYLDYAISRNWVDVTKLELDSQYSDAEEIYQQVVAWILESLENNTGFAKKMYKYMIRDEQITGRQICSVLLEQDLVTLDKEEQDLFESGLQTPYGFMIDRITNLEITPAQLNLDPYSGSVVITDVNTGDVLALVSYPSYDNNRMANGVDAEYFSKLREDLSTPLINYATQQKTAPGSTFKMVSATAGLLEGVITTTSPITCVGLFDKIAPPPRCWIYSRGGSHGPLNVTGGIQNSCNYFFYEVGYRLGTVGDTYSTDLGLRKLDKYAGMYGLTETSGIEIDESTPQTSTQDAVRAAIGQDNSGFTTVGLARYVTAVANSGACYNLTLLDKVTDHIGNTLYDNRAQIRNTVDMDPSSWNAIHLGMRKVVEGKSYFSELPVNVAGKTGTAEETTNRANHALFVCYAPYEKPEIAVATRVANGYTSDYAAQLTKDVLNYYFRPEERENLITNQASKPTGGISRTD